MFIATASVVLKNSTENWHLYMISLHEEEDNHLIEK